VEDLLQKYISNVPFDPMKHFRCYCNLSLRVIFANYIGCTIFIIVKLPAIQSHWMSLLGTWE